MRVLIVLDADVIQPLADEAHAAGHVVVQLTGASASDVTAHLRREACELLLVAAEPGTLNLDVVDACDARGIALVAVVDSRIADENARACGVSATVNSWHSWTDVEHQAGGMPHASSIAPQAIPTKGDESRVGLETPPRLFSPSDSLSMTGPLGTAHVSDPRVSDHNVDVRSQVDLSTPRVVVVWGPTGAPGRTTVALNLAAHFAQGGLRVALIDADTYGGAIAIRLGIFDEAPGIARACRLAGAEELTSDQLTHLAQEVRVKGHPLHVVTGILGSGRWPEVSRDRLERVLACARETYDIVVVDVGFSLESDEEISSDLLAPRRNAATHVALRSATDIVAVAGADSVGLSRFIRLWSDLTDINSDATVTVCVNHVVWERDGASARESITTAFARFAGIRDVVLIPECADLAMRADVRGLPAVLVEPTSAFARAVYEISRRVLGQPPSGGRTSLGEFLRASFRTKARGARLLG